jgi:hypothetical protein
MPNVNRTQNSIARGTPSVSAIPLGSTILVEGATQRWSEQARGVVERAAVDVVLLQREFGVTPTGPHGA